MVKIPLGERERLYQHYLDGKGSALAAPLLGVAAEHPDLRRRSGRYWKAGHRDGMAERRGEIVLPPAELLAGECYLSFGAPA